MSKTIVIRLNKIGTKVNVFSIQDDRNRTIVSAVPRAQLISGISATIDDDVKSLRVVFGGENCCNKFITIPIGTVTKPELVQMETKVTNTASVWKHLKDNTKYNSFYGCTHPYILEYPIAYKEKDEILQNVKDYSKVYKYLSETVGISDNNRKIQTNNAYFNQAIIYNDQQTSGLLELVSKPKNNMQAQISYPKFNEDSKTIIYSKSDNFYQYNTFWNVVKDMELPIFQTSCKSMSYDKELNQDNMDYSSKAFKKDRIMAKDCKIRHILNDREDISIVSKFILAPSQISYK